MKRQIRFRVWNPDDKKMETPLVLAIVNDGTLNFKPLINCSDGNKAYKDYPLMQFTGLQDIKGKDVYEGDIVNIYGGFGYLKNGEGVNANYIVSFKTCEYLLFRHDIKLTWGRLSRLEEMNYNCEIIGNIYENSELLKTTENE